MTDTRCRAGKDCVRSTTEGAGLTTKPSTLCHGCIEDIQTCYDRLPAMVTALQTMKGSWGGVSYEARVQSSKEPPIPLHINILDLIEECADVFDRTGGYMIHDLVTHGPEKWIIWRNGKRRETELDGVTRALDVRRVYQKAANRVGFDKVWQRRAAACPNCHLPTLGSWVGEENILCTNEDCLSAFTRTAYEELCITQARNDKGKKKR